MRDHPQGIRSAILDGVLPPQANLNQDITPNVYRALLAVFADCARILLESEQSPEFMKGIPMRRYGEFDDLDGPLLLLASDASRYMTGSVVTVDGGHLQSTL